MTQSVPQAETGPLTTTARTVIVLADVLEPGDARLLTPSSEGAFLVRLGALLSGPAGRLLLCSVVPIPQGESVSAFSIAAQARRQELERMAFVALGLTSGSGTPAEDGTSATATVPGVVAPVVRVAPESNLADELRRLVEGEPGALLLLPLKPGKRERSGWLYDALRNPLPCDVAWARPPLDGPDPSSSSTDVLRNGMKILLPARGGPQAAMALELSQDLMERAHAEVTVLHVLQDMPERERATEEAPFAELLGQLAGDGRGRIDTRRTVDLAHDPVKTITREASSCDLLVMGAGGEPSTDLGRFTAEVAKNTRSALLTVKTRIPVGPAIRAARRRARPHVLDAETLSLIVDKWFAENTFHADEFSDLSRLIDLKRKQGTTISLGLPALNEEETIGDVIKVLKTALMDDAPLLDEIVLIDSNSTDATREIAADLGIPVYIHQEVLPEAGEPHAGKGEALWKSLQVLKGDIIAWVDTDVANMHPQFVYGLVGPLLREPRIGYTKGYYHRPIRSGGDLQHEGGGRVTELTVRPLLNLFFPLLSGLVQPLAGEYAGRREVLERLPFFTGYGVETGMLIDLLESFGLASIGQVNLERRVHRNRSLADLSLTAFAIVQVMVTRLQERASIKLLEELNSSMKLIRFEEDHLSLVVRRVRDIERPPIETIPAYRTAHPARE